MNIGENFVSLETGLGEKTDQPGNAYICWLSTSNVRVALARRDISTETVTRLLEIEIYTVTHESTLRRMRTVFGGMVLR